VPYYLTFDIPTSTNKLYARTRKGVRLSDEARIYKEYASLTAANQWHQKYNQYDPLKGDISVTYRFYGSNADWDNLCKVLGDSMNNIVWRDDVQIIEAHVYMFRKDPIRRVEVSVTVL
jgi:Holliday junction resolvase RusA-like endonuclease